MGRGGVRRRTNRRQTIVRTLVSVAIPQFAKFHMAWLTIAILVRESTTYEHPSAAHTPPARRTQKTQPHRTRRRHRARYRRNRPRPRGDGPRRSQSRLFQNRHRRDQAGHQECRNAQRRKTHAAGRGLGKGKRKRLFGLGPSHDARPPLQMHPRYHAFREWFALGGHRAKTPRYACQTRLVPIHGCQHLRRVLDEFLPHNPHVLGQVLR